MKSWISKFCFLVLSFGLLPGVTSAQDTAYYTPPYYQSPYPYYDHGRSPYSPCCNIYCFGDFEVGADFIYWNPCIDDLEFAASVNTSSSNGVTTNDVKIKEICLDWEPGVRVYFYKPNCWCNLGFSGSYTYLNIDDSSKTGIGDYHSPLFHPHLVDGTMTDLSVKGDYEICYQEWDVLFYYDCECGCNALIRPYAGVAGIFLEQELKVEETFTMSSSSGVANVKWTSDYWGVGLRAGVHYEYTCCPCLTFFGWGHGTILYGEKDNENEQDCIVGNKEDYLTIDEDTKCHCIPGYHLGTGVRYDGCFCGCEYFLRLGYEFLVWYNLPNHRSFCGDNFTTAVAHGSSASVRTATLHGLFVGLGFSF